MINLYEVVRFTLVIHCADNTKQVIDNKRYQEHKEFKDSILKEVKRYNDMFDKDIKTLSSGEEVIHE